MTLKIPKLDFDSPRYDQNNFNLRLREFQTDCRKQYYWSCKKNLDLKSYHIRSEEDEKKVEKMKMV